jgi:hypothetical protein
MPQDFDDVKAGRPIERRLNRMERVVAAYRGQIDERAGNGLHIIFETADAALLGACEMQHRCAVLPQFSANRLALRIGIHHEVAQERSKDSVEDATKVAARLAAVDDEIIVSGVVVDALNSELRQFVRPTDSPLDGTAAYSADWRREIPSGAYGGEALWPTSKTARPIGPYLLLHLGLKTLELTRENPTATIGREPINDLVIVDDHVSRNHCRIERTVDGFALIDASTNGTCITPDDGEDTLVKKDSLILRGKGLLFFGRLCNGERRGGVRYEAY